MGPVAQSNKMDNEDEFYDSKTEFDDDFDEFFDSQTDELSFELEKFCFDEKRDYYAVQFIDKSKIDESLYPERIFLKREDALKFCKKNPDNCRFKLFKSKKEAEEFSFGLFNVSFNLNTPTSNRKQADAEKLPFSQPKTRDLNELRVFIEKNQLQSFKDRISNNPRYLISPSSDTPVTVQEAFHYNCLHICAKENRFEIANLLLDSITNPIFIRRLYFNDTNEQIEQRIEHILDLYLNTPEKGLNETPLHFACKFGSYEVTKALLSYKQCSKTLKNKNKLTPYEVICTKINDKSNLDKIKSLFDECYYVPFYRNCDKFELVIEKPVCVELIRELNEPLSSNNRLLTAYVGPTSPSKANLIYERLKSPHYIRKSPGYVDIIRSDDYKGYERIARKLSEEFEAPWIEYWDFLGVYTNLTTNEGLWKLEKHLRQKKIQSIIENQQRVIKEINQSTNDQNLKSFLDSLVKIIDNLKKILELKDDELSLSRVFDKIKELIENRDKIKLETNEIMIWLHVYLNKIIQINDLDVTSRAYFCLYKTAKLLMLLLGLNRFIHDPYLSAYFKIQNKNYSLYKEKMEICQNDDLNDSMEELNGSKAKKQDKEIESLTLSFKKIQLNEYKLNTRNRITSNDFSSKIYKKKFDVPTQKIFICGETPTKFDRAVYLAIRETRIDSYSYPVLYEWLQYMNNANVQSEMTKWTTPRGKVQLKRFVNINSH